VSALHTLPIPFVNPDSLIDTAAQIAALNARRAASEATYRAERDLINAFFDRRRDAALIAVGLIDAPVARTQELAR